MKDPRTRIPPHHDSHDSQCVTGTRDAEGGHFSKKWTTAFKTKSFPPYPPHLIVGWLSKRPLWNSNGLSTQTCHASKFVWLPARVQKHRKQTHARHTNAKLWSQSQRTRFHDSHLKIDFCNFYKNRFLHSLSQQAAMKQKFKNSGRFPGRTLPTDPTETGTGREAQEGQLGVEQGESTNKAPLHLRFKG